MVYVLFKINQAYIAANVCVNRDVPMSMCSGSCFLEDQLTETQSEDRDIPFSGFENKRSFWACHPMQSWHVVGNK